MFFSNQFFFKKKVLFRARISGIVRDIELGFLQSMFTNRKGFAKVFISFFLKTPFLKIKTSFFTYSRAEMSATSNGAKRQLIILFARRIISGIF